jgi:hypothetical protein
MKENSRGTLVGLQGLVLLWPRAFHSYRSTLKHEGFEDEQMINIGWRAFVNAMTLGSNQSY